MKFRFRLEIDTCSTMDKDDIQHWIEESLGYNGRELFMEDGDLVYNVKIINIPDFHKLLASLPPCKS